MLAGNDLYRRLYHFDDDFDKAQCKLYLTRMKITPPIFLTLILWLGGCADSANSQVKELETADVVSEKLIEDQSKIIDYSKMSSEELQEELKSSKIQMDKLEEKGIDSLSDEEFDRLLDIQQKRGELLDQLISLANAEADKAKAAADAGQNALKAIVRTKTLSVEQSDYSKMSSEELQEEIKKIKEKISKLEIGMDGFEENDPRWDILDLYSGHLLSAIRAQTAADIERGKRIDSISKTLGGEIAE